MGSLGIGDGSDPCTTLKKVPFSGVPVGVLPTLEPYCLSLGYSVGALLPSTVRSAPTVFAQSSFTETLGSWSVSPSSSLHWFVPRLDKSRNPKSGVPGVSRTPSHVEGKLFQPRDLTTFPVFSSVHSCSSKSPTPPPCTGVTSEPEARGCETRSQKSGRETPRHTLRIPPTLFTGV